MGCDCITHKNDLNEIDNKHLKEVGKIKNI
jgi:hypothetical protein